MFGINWGKFIGKNRNKSKTVQEDCTNNTVNDIGSKSTAEVSKSNYKDRNFELLAVDLVKSVTNNSSWEHTQWSNDNNHDGILCIALYENSSTNWWMESKFTYNLEGNSLSRYKLDSTVVSKLLMETELSLKGGRYNVQKIFIVTNCTVSPYVQENIIMSLNSNGNHCDVCFYQRSDVEFWLYTNQDKYKKYFIGDLQRDTTQTLYIDNKVQIYPERAIHTSYYYDPGTIAFIIQNQNYIFSTYIYCQSSKVTVKSSKNIKILKSNNIEIKNNKLQFVFCATDEPDSLVFSINGQNTPAVYFQYKPDYFITIHSHEKIKKKVNDFIDQNNSNACSLMMILGKVAVGKSTLLNSIMKNIHKNCYYISLSNEFSYNIMDFIRYIGHLILPYVPWSDLDTDYIEKLKEDHGTGFEILNNLLELYNELDKDTVDEEWVSNKIAKLKIEFSNELYYDTSVFFIDNIQNISDTDGEFLKKCLGAIANSSFKVKIICFGNTYFKDNNIYKDIKKYTTDLSGSNSGSLICEITNKDIIKHLNTTFNAHLTETTTKPFFTDLFEISAFIQYIRDNKINLDNDSSFNESYNNFKQSDISVNLIKNRMLTSINRCNKSAIDLLRKIYLNPRSVTGINLTSKNDTNILLQLELIKINDTNGYLEPYHDLYRYIYFKFILGNQDASDLATSMNDQKKLICNFVCCKPNTEEWKKAAEELYSSRHKFPHTVLFALEPFFCNVQDDNYALISSWGQEYFFKMYKAYITACGYASNTISISDAYKDFIELAKNYTDNIQIRRFIVDAYAALMEDAYESAEFDELQRLYNIFKERYDSLSLLIRPESDDWNVRKLLANSLLCYSQSLLDIPDAEENFLKHRKYYLKESDGLFHFYEDTARFARTLYLKNINDAISYTNCAISIMKSGKTHADQKQELLLTFQITYLNLIKNDKAPLLNDLIRQYKNFGEGFQKVQRNVRLALIAICLKYKNISFADELLTEEMQIHQPRNKRLEIFYWQAWALRNLKKGDLLQTATCLNKASGYACKIPTFLRIIQHNMKVISNNRIPENLEFAVSETLKSDTYYIDTRAVY